MTLTIGPGSWRQREGVGKVKVLYDEGKKGFFEEGCDDAMPPLSSSLFLSRNGFSFFQAISSQAFRSTRKALVATTYNYQEKKKG